MIKKIPPPSPHRKMALTPTVKISKITPPTTVQPDPCPSLDKDVKSNDTAGTFGCLSYNVEDETVDGQRKYVN